MMDGNLRGMIIAVGCAAFILSPGTAGAQVLTPAGYSGLFSLPNQEAIVVFQGGRQTLVLEARFELPAADPGEAGGSPPDRLGWVIPVPAGAAPSDPPAEGVFAELFQLSNPPAKQKYRLRTGRPTAIDRFGGNLFGRSNAAGENLPLTWTVMEGTGQAALAALKDWIAAHGLSGLSEELALDYAEEGWTFAAGVSEHPGDSGVLGPAVFQFPTEEVVLPLRFQADAGVFDLRLYIVTDRILDTRPLANWRISGVDGWQSRHRDAWFQGYMELSKAEPPLSLTSFVDRLRPTASEGSEPQTLYFHVLSADQLNGFGRTTARQTTDFALPEKGKTAARMTGRKTAEEDSRIRARNVRQRGYTRQSR